MLRGAAPTSERTLDWRVELPVAPGAIAVGRFAATLGLDRTQEFRLQTIERWGRGLEPRAPDRGR